MTGFPTSRAAVLWTCVGLLMLSRVQFATGQTLAPPEPPPEVGVSQLSDVLTRGEAKADSAVPQSYDVLAASCQNRECGWWLRGDALIGWIQGNPVPPLVTTGVLPGAKILFGDDRIDDAARGGVRLTLGHWLDDCREWGVEAHYAYLGDASGGGFFVDSTAEPILARPFLDAGLGVQKAQLLAYPGFLKGQISVDTLSEVHSAGVLLRHTWLRDYQGELALVGGYRYFRLRERLAVTERFEVLPDNFPFVAGTTVESQDSFAVQNDFHGGEIGLAGELERGRWSLDIVTKLGLGGVLQQLDITGATLVNGFPQGQGLLAQASNIGHHTDTRFAFLPELGVNASYCLTQSLSLRAGYSLLYLSDVLRSGQQIDASIGTDAGGTLHPQANLEHTSLWVQGINLGLEWRL